MRRAIRNTRLRLVWMGAILLAVIDAERSTAEAGLEQATFTQVINDVKLLPAGGTAAKPIAIKDTIGDGSSVQTGRDSRTELTFTGQTLARLSANTIFKLNRGTRNLELNDGAVLLRVPKGAGRATISTGAVTAAITGTTVIVEYHPQAYLKFISLQGTARLSVKHRWGESVLVRPGQILITNPEARSLPGPVDVDLDRLLKTARLIVDFPPLDNRNLIAKERERQLRDKSKRKLIDTNLVIFGKGTLVSLTNPAQITAGSGPADAAGRPGSNAVPSSTDIGAVETPPVPDGSSAADDSRDRSP